MTALEIFQGSDAGRTRTFYADLTARGPLGEVATNLFRAQKTSHRAKQYRGGNGRQSFKSMSYERKEWSLGELCKILPKYPELEIRWGWKSDGNTIIWGDTAYVLYVDLPPVGEFEGGQVSFHAPKRGEGPDYSGDWDGKKLSADRIIQFCDAVMEKSRAHQPLDLFAEMA